MVATAVEQLQQWQQAGFEIQLSINISAYHLQSPGFVDKLGACASQGGTCLQRLQIEVLETAALEDIARIGALIKACRQFGVGFALDDFGTGYTSITYLSKLDVDTLKIDQSFVRDMQQARPTHAIVQGIIALARMHIVAEGWKPRRTIRHCCNGLRDRPGRHRTTDAWPNWSAGVAQPA